MEATERPRNNITVTSMLMLVLWAVIMTFIYIHFIALIEGSRVDTLQPVFWDLIGLNSMHQYIVTGSISTKSIDSRRKFVGTIDCITFFRASAWSIIIVKNLTLIRGNIFRK